MPTPWTVTLLIPVPAASFILLWLLMATLNDRSLSYGNPSCLSLRPPTLPNVCPSAYCTGPLLCYYVNSCCCDLQSRMDNRTTILEGPRKILFPGTVL